MNTSTQLILLTNKNKVNSKALQLTNNTRSTYIFTSNKHCLTNCLDATVKIVLMFLVYIVEIVLVRQSERQIIQCYHWWAQELLKITSSSSSEASNFQQLGISNVSHYKLYFFIDKIIYFRIYISLFYLFIVISITQITATQNKK